MYKILVALAQPLQAIIDTARAIIRACPDKSESTFVSELVDAIVILVNEMVAEASALYSPHNTDLVTACMHAFRSQMVPDQISPWAEHTFDCLSTSLDWEKFFGELEVCLPDKQLAGLFAITAIIFVKDDKLVTDLRFELTRGALEAATRQNFTYSLARAYKLGRDLCSRDFKERTLAGFGESETDSRKLLFFLVTVFNRVAATVMAAGDLDNAIDSLRGEAERIGTLGFVEPGLIANLLIKLTSPLIEWRPSTTPPPT